MDDYELLARAVELIDEYAASEYEDEDGIDVASADLSDIGLMFTTTDDYDELQVSVDLINHNMNYYVNGELIHQDHYNSLEALIDDELSNLDFDWMYGDIMGYGRAYYGDNFGEEGWRDDEDGEF